MSVIAATPNLRYILPGQGGKNEFAIACPICVKQELKHMQKRLRMRKTRFALKRPPVYLTRQVTGKAEFSMIDLPGAYA